MTGSRTVALVATAMAVAGCEASPTAPEAFGRMLARESLAVVDGGPLPCCGIVGGVLTFYRATYYPDSVATPAGMIPAACVQTIPSGAFVHSNSVVTLPDGGSYIILGCSSGTYSLTVSQQPESSTSRDTNETTVSAGVFNWKRDTLTIADPQLGGRYSASASMAGTTVTVTARGHSYQFVPFAGP